MGLLADLVSLALAIAVGYLAAATPAGPIVSWPGIWRFAAFLIVTSFAKGVFSATLGLLVPLLTGPANLAEVIAFLGGVVLLIVILLIYSRLGARKTTTGL